MYLLLFSWGICTSCCPHRAGETEAIFDLACLLEEGRDELLPEDTPRAVSLFEQAIGFGDHFAIYRLALLMLHGGPGVERDHARAIELYEQAAEAGNVSAMFDLGCLYESGPSANLDRAMELFEQAAELDSYSAMTSLANLLCKTDAGRAAELYERAIAEGNDTHAMCRLGDLLLKGVDAVDGDAKKALELFERGDEMGDSGATNRLGMLMEKGAQGIEPNAAKALELYERSVDSGNDQALWLLAELVERGGDGVPKDIERARQLREEAEARQ